MYSLYIDTHGKKVTIVLFKNKKIDKIIEEESNNNHSITTMPNINKIIGQANINVNDLNEIIVVNGPGSFTGSRIAVTIAKTMAYCLQIPIKTIDYLTVLAINDNRNQKYVSIIDRNGAFVGTFDQKNNTTKDFIYLNNNDYKEFTDKYNCLSEIEIDYNKVYKYIENIEESNVHSIKPLYVKGISALHD